MIYLVWLRLVHRVSFFTSQQYEAEQLLGRNYLRSLMEAGTKPHLEQFVAKWVKTTV